MLPINESKNNRADTGYPPTLATGTSRHSLLRWSGHAQGYRNTYGRRLRVEPLCVPDRSSENTGSGIEMPM